MVHPVCISGTPSLYQGYTQFVSGVYTVCIRGIHSLYPWYSQFVSVVYPVCIRGIHSLYPWYTQFVISSASVLLSMTHPVYQWYTKLGISGTPILIRGTTNVSAKLHTEEMFDTETQTQTQTQTQTETQTQTRPDQCDSLHRGVSDTAEVGLAPRPSIHMTRVTLYITQSIEGPFVYDKMARTWCVKVSVSSTPETFRQFSQNHLHNS